MAVMTVALELTMRIGHCSCCESAEDIIDGIMVMLGIDRVMKLICLTRNMLMIS